MTTKRLASNLSQYMSRNFYIELLRALEQDPEGLRQAVQGHAMNQYPGVFTEKGLLKEVEEEE